MLPQREFDHVQQYLIRALCELKGWSISREQYLQIRTIANAFNVQLMTSVVLDNPEHVCGLEGYNAMIDPPCPACYTRIHKDVT